MVAFIIKNLINQSDLLYKSVKKRAEDSSSTPEEEEEKKNEKHSPIPGIDKLLQNFIQKLQKST